MNTQVKANAFLQEVDEKLNAGSLAEAKGLLGKLDKKEFSKPSIKKRLAAFFFYNKEYEKAIKLYTQLIREVPNEEVNYTNCATAYQMSGSYEFAIKMASAAVAKFPDKLEVHIQAGKILYLQEKYKDLYWFLDKSLKRFPNDVEMLTMRAAAQITGNFYDWGQVDLETALEQVKNGAKGDELSILAALIKVYYKAGEDRLLAHTLQKTYEKESSDLAVLTILIEFFEKTGNLERTKEMLDQALTLYPESDELQVYKAIYLSRIKDMEGFKSLIETLDIDEEEKKEFAVKLYFEKGKFYDKQGQFDEAFECYSRMNRFTVDVNGGLAATQNLAKEKTHMVLGWRKLIPRMADRFNTVDAANEDEAPVFFVGFPRSGTTMVDQILTSHSEIEVIEEKPTISSLVLDVSKRLGGFPNEAILNLDENELQKAREFYARTLQHFRKNERSIVIDKLPLNIVQLPLILHLYPNAKIIVAVRHPMDAVLSCFFQLFSYNASMAHFLTVEDTVNYYENVMGNFLLMQKHYSKQFLTYRYEDMVADLKGVASKILDYLDLPWDDAMLNFHETAKKRAVINTPSYTQVTQPLYSSSVYKWKNYQKHIIPFEPQLRPFIEAFGYQEPISS